MHFSTDVDVMSLMLPRVDPTIVQVDPESRQTFAINGKFRTREWSVNGIPGGNAELGTIGADGIYVAPSEPARGEINIGVRTSGRPSRSCWATVVFQERYPYYSFDGFWDGKRNSEISESHSVCMDGEDRLLLIDPVLSKLFRFTTSGDFLGEVGLGKGSGPGEMDGPRDAKVSAVGEIYVADGNNGRIQVFSGDGDYLRAWGGKGSGRGRLLRPHCVDLGPNGTVYVVDVDNNKVLVYSEEGKLHREWGRLGSGICEFLAPHGLGCDPNGDVFVSDFYGRCQKLTAEGEEISCFANPCQMGRRSHGDFRYHSMNTDGFGNVYLMSRNTVNDYITSVDKYNNNGDLVARLRPPPREFHFGSEGAAVGPDGTLYVADNGREHAGVTIFRPR